MGDNGEEKQQLEGVTEVQDSDVLCGRGGAALRHAGNQTYRKLVSLNKGLYITCLKTEKLKISRSIVAAIREKKGRFLEKDAASGTWYDIGDKKAVEKTSQALREGQPKLRQQIVEMGGGAVGAASLIESQFGPQAAAAVTGAGLYPSSALQQQQAGGQMMTPHNQQQQSIMSSGNMQQQMQQQRMMNQQGYAAMQQRHMQQQQMGALPFDDLQNDLMSRLSLHDDNNPGMAQQGNMRQQMPVRQQPVMTTNGMDPQLNIMPDYGGGYGGGQGMHSLGGVDDGGGMPMDNSFRAAMRGMTSPGNSVGGSLHSALDFASMHSMQDYMNGLSNHSLGGTLSNHSMGPPSSHLPTMSSISRQQQIDERYPQNMGLGDHHPGGMGTQNFRRQGQDNGPPQPTPPEQHPGSSRQQIMGQQQQQKIHPGQPSRGYVNEPDLEPISAFAGGSRGIYPDDQQQQRRDLSAGYPQETTSGPGNYNDRNGGQQMRNVPSSQGYNDPSRVGQAARRGQRTLEDERVMAPPDRNTSASTEGTSNSKGGTSQSVFSLNQSMASVTSGSTTPSVLRAETRQKMDRRNLFARMKYSRPPSIRDQKMGLAGASTHSTGDGMPDIHMVSSQLSLHSTLSNMTDGNSTHANKTSSNNNSGNGPLVETAKVVDHSSRGAEYMDVLASGSRHSIMSGLSRISDHSLNDASIFSLSKQIGGSTRSIAMSEISVIDVAERDGEGEEGASKEGVTESQE